MGRPPCCDKSYVKRGLWTAEEDAKILHYISTHGTGNWTSVPKKAGLKRCGKSCRLRWTNYLRPNLKHDSFTPQEAELIVNLHAAIGSRWSMIAAQLPGRTDNDVKNYWNTKLRKKLRDMGIDPVTHKPISQILADYGNIGLPRPPPGAPTQYPPTPFPHIPTTRTIPTCFARDLKNALSKSPPPHDTTELQYSSQSPYPPFSGLNPAWGLLAQLQAVQLVADYCTTREPLPAAFFAESSSSSSSSSTPGGTIGLPCHDTPPLQPPFNFQYSPHLHDPSSSSSSSSFSWSEFLSDDVFCEELPNHEVQEISPLSAGPQVGFLAGESAGWCSGVSAETREERVVAQQGFQGGGDQMLGASSSNSFVDDMLDRDSEMLWEFPHDIVSDS